jgi:CRISPR-associated RAMP protein (TIGR02581 family)
MTEIAQGRYGFDTLRSRTHVGGQLTALTSLRIGTGGDTGVSGTDLPVMRDSFDRPFIPGSSFKGVLRTTLEALVRGLSDDPNVQRQRLACGVLRDEQRCIRSDKMKEWREGEARNDPEELAKRVLDHSCLICQTFGSTWLAARVAVRDLMVDPSVWFGQFEIRQAVAIERDTETAAANMLYDFETVPPGTRFELMIETDNLADWQKGLLLLGLQRFVDGELAIGGGRSRGLGRVELRGMSWSGWELGDDRVASVMALLGQPMQPIAEQTMLGWRAALAAKLEEARHV